MTTALKKKAGVKAAARALKKLKDDGDVTDITVGGKSLFKPEETGEAQTMGIAGDQLRAYVERIERLESEKADMATDLRELYGEAKGNGFDTKILRRVIAIRKQDSNERAEQEAVLDTYLNALGMK